jgi:hypothetical protein
MKKIVLALVALFIAACSSGGMDESTQPETVSKTEQEVISPDCLSHRSPVGVNITCGHYCCVGTDCAIAKCSLAELNYYSYAKLGTQCYCAYYDNPLFKQGYHIGSGVVVRP